ncbi:hypothetical protein OIU85_001034, partial [Salix viminalis]
MDVDASMVATDHDPAPQNASSAAPTEMDGELIGEQSQQPAGSQDTSTAAVTGSSTTTTAPQQVAQAQAQQQSPVVGPRHAPTYSVVNANMDKKEDGPGPRCGHTLTNVAAVGEEGTPGYIGPRLILFGGATALEGNSASTGTPSSAGSAGI